jgi:hypothetical protein
MSRFESRSLKLVTAAALLAAALLAFAPATNAQELSHGLEIAVGASYNSSAFDREEFDFSTFGIRYRYHWTDRWGIEASYTQQDQGLNAEIYEISMRLGFYQNERVNVFAFVGSGWLSYEFLYPLHQDSAPYLFSNDTVVLSSGIAAEVNLGDRLYLRPDFRGRYAFDIFGPYDDFTTELTLAVGYRL